MLGLLCKLYTMYVYNQVRFASTAKYMYRVRAAYAYGSNMAEAAAAADAPYCTPLFSHQPHLCLRSPVSPGTHAHTVQLRAPQTCQAV
jgi:hypothetical protein